MNQILVTEKIYLTPELKRKKKIYKINFLLSIILIVILFSFYAYAEYDRNKNEDISQDILAGMTSEDNTTINKDSNVWIIALDGSTNNNVQIDTSTEEKPNNPVNTERVNNKYTASNGRTYTMVGKVSIPSINVNYPILSETTDALLKVSVCKFWGCEPNEVGNLCIAGHNYRNSRFFSIFPFSKRVFI